MSGNGSSGGRTFVLAFLVLGAIALGIGFVTFLKSGTSDAPQTAAIAAEPATIGVPQQQAAPAVDTAEQDRAVQAQGTVELVATDDPLYLSCIEPPLRQDETREQRVAYCNEQLKQAQAGGAPAPR